MDVANRRFGIVSARFNHFDFEIQIRPARLQRIYHQSGLSNGEFAAAGADNEFEPSGTLHIQSELSRFRYNFATRACSERCQLYAYDSDGLSELSSTAGWSDVRAA